MRKDTRKVVSKCLATASLPDSVTLMSSVCLCAMPQLVVPVLIIVSSGKLIVSRLLLLS